MGFFMKVNILFRSIVFMKKKYTTALRALVIKEY